MGLLAGFLDHVGRLVHESARSCDVERARHRAFLASRFALFVAVACAMVLMLAAGHVPAAWEAVAFGWALLPLGAAIHVSRTGRLDHGEAATLFAWWGLALTTALGGVVSLVGGCVLLLIGPLEAAISQRRRSLNVAVGVASLGLATLGAAHLAGFFPPDSAPLARGDVTVALPAMAFLVVLARCTLTVQMRRAGAMSLGEKQYRVLAEVIGDLVLRCDRDGDIKQVGPDSHRVLAVRSHDLLGRGFCERVHPADRSGFLGLVAQAADTLIRTSARIRFDVSLEDDDRRVTEAAGRFVWLEVRARRLEDRSGSVVMAVRDITAQVEHEQAIERAKEDAERHSRWKDSFLANVSHELRTPLNAIIGFSEMLASADLSPADPAKRREYAGIITSSGQHLLGVVNSLLDISKIEAGRFDLNPEPFAVDAMVAACCAMVGLKAEQAGVGIRRDLAGDLGEIVGDKRACKQILINLLSNAIKFTPAGGTIVVTGRRERNELELAVADTGIGIAAADLRRLGDAFFQAHDGHDRPYEGTGLGLSVVRGLCGLHGGAVSIVSAPGQGTIVTVRLPTDCRSAKPAEPAIRIHTAALPRPTLVPVRLTATPKVQKVA